MYYSGKLAVYIDDIIPKPKLVRICGVPHLHHHILTANAHHRMGVDLHLEFEKMCDFEDQDQDQDQSSSRSTRSKLARIYNIYNVDL